jgi:hypothetical protein
MASEATLIFELEPPIPFTVAEATGIAKGAILLMSDPMTAATSTASDDIIAGIAAEEKVASDGRTKLAVYIRGIFKMEANGTITVGQMVKSDATNATNTVIAVAQAAGAIENVLGRALETAADGETFLVHVNPFQFKDEA